ncbi:alpha/beta fold hydrolase [Variovorax boronicumulans]|uniref:alpha/beta fold hydrolase n=1 Tax=Variovorax boronicumulans TaxID=436515 RepID=UPI001C55E01E
MTTHFVDGLAVEVEGEGTPVVCVHGLGGSSNNWSPVMKALRGFQVIRIDLPGSARSAGAAHGALSIQVFVDAIARVCERLSVRGAHFLGHSLGTIVCQHLAVQQPALVRSLALFGPLVCPPEAARPNIRARAQKAASEGLPGLQLIADQIVQAATAAATRESSPIACALVRESVMRQDPQGYAKSCEALADAQSADLEALKVPTLLVTGDEDAVAPPSHVHAMAQRIAGARVQVLNRCGHWTTFERPQECERLLADFLARA